MTIYAVTNNATNEVVYRYEAEAPVEWVGMEFSTHTHTAEPDAAPPPPVPVFGGRRELTKLEFVALLGQTPFGAILSVAKQSVGVEAFVKMIDLATPTGDKGYSILLDDPRVAPALEALEPTLVALGAAQAGWAAGVLNG